jgi:tRNA threonylcarbamoyladenosine biosynthesis protein TsaE
MSQIIINNLTEIPAAAKELVKSFHGKVIAFYGEMGVGKTTLIKAICEEMSVSSIVSSPTFSIVNEYHTVKDEKIYHFDFYRIQSIDEAYDLGYEEYFYSKNHCLIEWPEKIGELLPIECEKVTITLQGDLRVISY